MSKKLILAVAFGVLFPAHAFAQLEDCEVRVRVSAQGSTWGALNQEVFERYRRTSASNRAALLAERSVIFFYPDEQLCVTDEWEGGNARRVFRPNAHMRYWVPNSALSGPH